MLKLKGEEKTFEQLIGRSVSTGAKAFIWDLEANEIIRVPVELKNYNAYKKVVNFEIDHRAKEYIKDLIRGPGLLKFYIPDSQLLFVSKVETYRGTHLEVHYPEAFQKHDRRREDRLEPLIPVYFKIDGMKKECYDVSFGGFSFILNGLEFRNLKLELGQVLECNIEFPTKKIKVKGSAPVSKSLEERYTGTDREGEIARKKKELEFEAARARQKQLRREQLTLAGLLTLGTALVMLTGSRLVKAVKLLHKPEGRHWTLK